MSRRGFTTLICTIAIAGLAQCGDEDALSKQVTFSVNPEIGLVMDAPIVINVGTDAEEEVSAPWFKWNYHFVNASAEGLVVSTVKFKYTTRNGTAMTSTSGELDPTVACPDPDYDNGDTGRSYLVAIPSNAQVTGYTDSCNYNTYTTTVKENWFIELPPSSNLVYQIEMTPIGWFEDSSGNQIARLNIKKYMTAQ